MIIILSTIMINFDQLVIHYDFYENYMMMSLIPYHVICKLLNILALLKVIIKLIRKPNNLNLRCKANQASERFI